MFILKQLARSILHIFLLLHIGRICDEGDSGGSPGAKDCWRQVTSYNYFQMSTDKKKSEYSWKKTNISKQIGNLLLPSFLTCISIYSFISKAIKLLFVSTTYYNLEIGLMEWFFFKTKQVPISKGKKDMDFWWHVWQRNRKKRRDFRCLLMKYIQFLCIY